MKVRSSMLLSAFSDFGVFLAAGGLLLAQGCRRRYYSQAGSRSYCFISREIDAANGGKWRRLYYTVLMFGMSLSQAGVFLCGWEGPRCLDHFEQLQAVLWSESLCPERHRADRGRLREQRAICRRSLESARRNWKEFEEGKLLWRVISHS